MGSKIIMPADNSHYAFKHHPETCDPDDVWGQVKRTIAGKPLPPEQITLILDAVKAGLDLVGDDVLLDLCCGNGALTTHLFGACRGGLGVDYSPFLIEVANRRFVRHPGERFHLADALDYAEEEPAPQRFSKILCYGAFPYFGHEAAYRLIETLGRRFGNATHLYLGQLPDKTRMRAFFTEREPASGEADDPSGLLGLWRTPSELLELAAAAGWKARTLRLPDRFFAAHYRFDAILTRS